MKLRQFLSFILGLLCAFVGISAHATPDRTTDVSVTTPDPYTANVTFTIPNPGGAAITAVEIKVRTPGTITTLNYAATAGTIVFPFATGGAPAGTKVSAQIGGLAPSTTYYVGLKTKDTVWSVLSNTLQFTTPTQFRTGHLAWISPQDERVVGYYVLYGTSPGGPYSYKFDAGNTTTYPVGNLYWHQTYCFVVRSRDAMFNESVNSGEACLN